MKFVIMQGVEIDRILEAKIYFFQTKEHIFYSSEEQKIHSVGALGTVPVIMGARTLRYH